MENSKPFLVESELLHERITLVCKAKRQYLITCKVIIYRLLALHGSTALCISGVNLALLIDQA